MATPPNDDSRMLFKLIADGDWHDYEQVRDKIAAAVPPGRALRKYQERVEYRGRYKAMPGYDTEATEDERIFYGQKACGQIVITSWKGRGLQFRGEGPNKQIRMRPGFKTWGVDVMGPSEDETGSGVGRGTPGDSEPSEPGQRPLEPPEEPEQALLDQEPEEDSMPGFDEPQEAEPPPFESASSVDPQASEYYDWASPRVTENRSQKECEFCGAWVIDQSLHDQFHQSFEARGSRSDMALFSEREIVTLLGDVMGQVLDKFQRGMEEYLEGQFADVHAALRASRRPPGRWSDGSNQPRF